MAGKTSANPIHAALELDPIIHERVRLAILSALGTQGRLSFNELKALTEATDGNLSTHSQKLEQAGYVRTSKGMFGRRTQTSYEITPAGRQALMNYLDALDRLMGEVRGK
ncbi:MAG: transcriptional regulator [Planctomycetes bacterium]|nr:transcriptional regulator [Planctomycetota bacterium]MCB9936027.1 transcriptional regulator [Planctomycetota bacterium]MCZ7607256.1 transcriptional regulator [Planctomycetota bacterium]